MAEFLFSALKHVWPYYVLALLVAEVLLLTKERKGLVLEICLTLAISIALSIVIHVQGHNSWASENRPVLLAFVDFLSLAMPLVVFVVANQFLARIRSTVKKHAALFLMVLLTMFVWPLWSLYVACASGLDCL